MLQRYLFFLLLFASLSAWASPKRPVVALCWKEEGCPWSQKLKESVLQDPLFHQALSQKAILWQVPLEKNEEVRRRYQITTSPTILLLDPQGREFARLTQLPLEGHLLAPLLISRIEDFQKVCLALKKKEISLAEGQWQELYQKAKQCSDPYFSEAIVERALSEEKGHFFHLEKFAALLEKHKLRDPLVQKYKEQLLKRDPKSNEGVHFHVAALEFRKQLSRLKPQDSIYKPLKPLVRFLEQFKEKDQENAWRAAVLIAEYLFTKNEKEIALKYENFAHALAPETKKASIAETIAWMEKE